MGTMRLPSRRMKQKAKPNIPALGVVFLVTVIVGFLHFVYISSPRAQCVAFCLVCAFCLWTQIENRREWHRLQCLASGRPGESLCKFARGFDRKKTDTWIIRAVHEELQLFLTLFIKFPLRVTDLLVEDLGLEVEDVDDLIVNVADRAGRSLEQPECNPYYGNVRTAADVVQFVNAQPPHSN
jgi:hypothetical protein